MALTELKGRVIANGWIYGSNERVTLVVHPSVKARTHDHLNPFMRFARCEIEDSGVEAFITSDTGGTLDDIALHPFEVALTLDANRAINLDTFQLENGYVLVSEAVSGVFLPQMLNLTAFGTVSFEKGCYLGQEIVARAEHRGQVKRALFKTMVSDQALGIGERFKLESGQKATLVAKAGDAALCVGPRLSSTPLPDRVSA